MIKSNLLSIVLAAATAILAHAKITIPVGAPCAGFAGPLPWSCAPGSTCCSVGPGRSLCALGSSCPKEFVPVGGLCEGFAGPSPYPCWPGTKCCYISPDNSVCKYNCNA